jgi:tetratricopeptide (TPR) repeat protein
MGNFRGNPLKWGTVMEAFLKRFKKEKELTAQEKAKVYFRDGKIFMEQGQHDKAIERFEEALKLDAKLADAHDYMGRCYMEQDVRERALEEFQRALDIDPDRWETHYHKGVVFGRMKKYREALEEYKKELELNPRYGAAHNNLSITYFTIKNYPLAKHHCEIARKMGCHIDPDFDAALSNTKE